VDQYAVPIQSVTANLGLSGTDAGNYELTQPVSLTANITAKSVTVTGVTADSKTYDGTTNATLNGTAAAGFIGGDNVSLNLTSATFVDKNAGTNKTVTADYDLTGDDAANYDLTDPTGLTADITAKSVSVTGVTANNKTYDGSANATLNGTASAGFIGGDNVSLTLTSATFADKNVGTNKTVTADYDLAGDDAANYDLTDPAGLTADISKASLSVTGVTANNKTYDGTTNATLDTANASLSGKVGNDSVSLNGTAGSFVDKNAGTNKSVTANLGLSGTDAGNYELTQPVSLTANITAKSVTVTGVTADGKTYDGTTNATLNTSGASLSGKVGNDSVSLNGTAGSFADKNAGTNKSVTANLGLSGTDAGNYELTQPVNLTADITKASLSVTGVTANNKTYDGSTNATLNTSAANLSGILANDSVSLNGTAGSFADKNAGTNKSVTANLGLSGTDAGNYELTQPVNLTADITKANLSLTGVTASDKTYDGTTTATVNTSAANITGVIGADNVSLSGSANASFADKNAGTNKTITTNFTLAGADAGNYQIDAGSFTANISKASLSVTGVTANNKTYDGTTNATLNTSGASLSGKVGNDSVSLNGTAGSFADKNAGTNKSVTANLGLSGTDAGNYELTQPVNLTADITKASLTLSGVTANNKTYDGSTNATLNTANASLTGKVGNDSVSLNGTAGSFADKNAGTNKSVTANLGLSGTDAGNYELTQPVNLTADITKANLSLTGVTASDKTYDGTTTATVNTSAANITGVIGADNVSLSGSANASFADKNAGTNKTITTNFTLMGADAGNYQIDPGSFKANISKASLTIGGNATAQDKVYDGTTNATLAGTASLSGVFGSDAVNLSASAGARFADKNVGTNKTVTTNYTLTGTDAGNYELTQLSGLKANITAANLTITGVSASNKVYDGTTAANLSGGASISAYLGDNVSVSLVSASFSDKNAGTNKTVSVIHALSGADAGNYNLVQLTGLKANINKANLTLSGVNARNKKFDGNALATLTGNVTLSSFAGDLVNVSLVSARFNNNKVGNNKAVTAVFALGGADAGNYNLVQPTNLKANITASTACTPQILCSGKIPVSILNFIQPVFFPNAN
jgi:hypothetical protein